MPDITKCEGVECETRSTCYRYTSKPSKYRQAYFLETPTINGECEHYWDTQYKIK